ncbi:MAG: TolC family protein [Parvularcula sp.]|jgi:outer membrane protein TolC|nr:TolC family protein [Parvularcula sp.]
MIIRLLLFVLVSALAGLSPAAAQDLMPEDVARSVVRHFPLVMEARAERRAAVAGRLEARGAFDTTVRGSATSRLDGYYSGDFADLSVEKPLGPWGTEVYGGYRLSQGDFPVYEDEYVTNQGGEVRLGVLFSLLRDRVIDARRAGLIEADLALESADLELLLTRVEAQNEGLSAYWQWVAAGRILEVYRTLLDLAETRDVALRREVEVGARAEIFLTENAQNLIRRRELVRRAEQDLLLAANRLSLYLRSVDGAPLVPSAEALPEGDLVEPLSPAELADAEAVLARRPDIQLLELAKTRAELRQRLARNEMRPRLDLNLEASDDQGAFGPNGFTRDEAEVKAGLTFSVPLGRRAARGRLAAAEAEADAIGHRERFLRDRIGQELGNILVTAQTAEDILELTRQEAEQAEILRRAELRRFENGASDFFLVNLREQTAANARVRVAEAELALARAVLAYRAATFDTAGLLMDGQSPAGG